MIEAAFVDARGTLLDYGDMTGVSTKCVTRADIERAKNYDRGRAVVASGEINHAVATVAMQLANQNLITKDEAMRLIPFD